MSEKPNAGSPACVFAAVVMAACGVFAQAPLAGQAMSETMGRALAPSSVRGEGKAPEAKPKEAAPKADARDSIVIGEIARLIISGPEFIEEEGVRALLESSLVDGKVKTVGDLRAAIALVRQELQAKGYYLAAVNPASSDAYNSAEKTLSLIVDAGRFGNIDVDLAERDGWHWYSREQVARRMKGINRNDIFNYNRLRSAIAGMNSHPDLLADTKISLRESAGEGDKADSPYTRFADVKLDVDDSFPLHFVWDINNYGMEEIDDWQTSLTVQYLNLTRADDVLTFSPATSFNGDLWSFSASYMRPFDWLNGMNATIYGGYSDLECDTVLPSLSLEGTGWFAGLNWSANIYDDDVRNFAFNAGLMYRYIEDEWNVLAAKLRKRDIGILPLTVGFSYADKKGDWLNGRDFFNVGYSINLASTGDDLESYSDNADEHYMILRGGWQRLQPLFAESIPEEQKWRAWSVFTRLEGQYSPDVLITAERLAYGGYNCLRGYRTRGYLGDNGVYGTVELRTPVICNPIAGLFCDMNGKSPFDRFQLLGFVDAGWVNFNDTYPNMEDDEFLYSAGFGIRAGLTKYLSLNCDVAFPLRDAYAHNEDDDVEVYLSVKFQW